MELIALCIPLVGLLLWFVLWRRIVWSQRERRERRPWRYTFGIRRRRTSDTVKPPPPPRPPRPPDDNADD